MTGAFRWAVCLVLASVLTVFLAAGGAHAQERKLEVELNAAQAVDKGCRISFLVKNGMATEIGASVFEVAVIGKDGRVSNLIRLDFGRLPKNKSRVRQFDLAGKGCGDVGRILLNDVAECSGDGLTPDVCLDALAVSARGDIAFDL